MDLDLIKDYIEYEQSIAENDTKMFIKEEYVIPDTLPDVDNILMLDVKPMITNKEVGTDKVNLEGQLQYTILYMAKDGGATEAHSVVYNGNIFESIDMIGAQSNMYCDIELNIEHMDCVIINERKIAIQGFIICKCNGYNINSFEIVKDVHEGKDIQFLKNPMTVDKVMEPIETELVGKAEVKIDMDKNECLKVIKYDVTIGKKDVRIYDGGLKIEAMANVAILYKGKNGRDLFCVSESVPLYKEVTVDELKPNMEYFTEFEVQSFEYDVRQDDMGENRVIDVEFVVKAITHVMYKEEVEVIQDVYCPTKLLNMDIKENNINVIQGHGYTESLVKGDIDVKNDDLKPIKVIMTTGNVSITDKNIKNDKIEIEGLLKVDVLYSTEDEEQYLVTVEDEIPFSCKVDIAGTNPNMQANANISLEMIEGSLEAGNVSIRAIVKVHCKAYYNIKNKFVVNMAINDGEVPEKKASIIIYVVQPEDTLWSIAKKYLTTVDEIMNINELAEGEEVKPSQKLIIPGRATV
ncbi:MULTISPECIES: SPOCS domain-containing protein [unclassified Clostridium]|nr:peptidoglycan-binding protein [Clostridium sp.]HCO73823.1 peptidoglycan-binding protein [Clostridium sp.]